MPPSPFLAVWYVESLVLVLDMSQSLLKVDAFQVVAGASMCFCCVYVCHKPVQVTVNVGNLKC